VKEQKWFYALMRVPLTIYVYVLTRLHAEGTEHIPATGPVIFVSNHLSMMDILAVAVPTKRLLHFMAKIELFQVPVFGGVIRLLGAFPVRRGESDRESLRVAGELLAAGQVVVIFPEGHRSDYHALQPGHTGVALIAMRSGAPIVPIGVSGTEHVGPLRIGPWAPRVRIVFGEPFTLPSAGRRTREDLERGIDQIMRRIAALLPPEYRGVYADSGEVPVGAATNGASLDVGGADPLEASRALDAEQDPPAERTPPAGA
jgi:1-acyl-sn-glycerol-3-phosphate acyltransferase